MSYTIEAASEWGNGIGPNGTGRRAKVTGFYVISPRGRKVRAFTGPQAEAQAKAWAVRCDEMQEAGQIDL